LSAGHEERGEGVGLGVEARVGELRALGLSAQDVDHIIDHDAAQQPPACIDDRGRDQVQVPEAPRHVVGRHRHVDRAGRGAQMCAHLVSVVVHQQVGNVDPAQIAIVFVGHHQAVQVRGQSAVLGAVLAHRLRRLRQRVARPHGHRVGVHQPAGGVVRVSAQQVEASAPGGVHAGHHLVEDRRRQVGVDVRERIQVQRRNRLDEFACRHALDQLAPHLAVRLDQHLAVTARSDLAPGAAARPGVHRLEGVGDCACSSAVEQLRNSIRVASVDGGGQGLAPARDSNPVGACGLGVGVCRAHQILSS